MLLHVAAGIILKEDQTFLIGRKKINSSNEGLWEFPGGKIEADESASEALQRELKEELGVKILIQEDLGIFSYSTKSKTIILHCFICSCNEIIHESTDHDHLEWININQVNLFLFSPADLPIVDALKMKIQGAPEND